jgi:winged helix DNA-binding protein
MYIGLWTRLHGFEREALTRALERRSVIQATLMRTTIHLVSKRDYWPLEIAVAAQRREWWRRTHRSGPEDREMEAAARRLRKRLKDGPLQRKEVKSVVGKTSAVGIGLWLSLVRVPPSGTWERRRADLYAAAEDWLGEPAVSPDDALDLVVRRYLGGFGPASRKDIFDWSGLPASAIDPVLERLTLRRFRDEDGNELLDLPRAPLPDPDTPAPVRFLPVWDANLLVHARRTGILPQEHRPRLFNTKTPHSFPTFLVDGAVAGTWRHADGRIELSPFGELDRATRRELDDEAERLAAFLA